MSRPVYDVILLDFDDTLVDFAAAERGALASVLTARDLAFTEAHYGAYAKISKELWHRFDTGELAKAEVFARRWEAFFGALGLAADAAPANERFLEGLVEHSVVTAATLAAVELLARSHRLAIVTNGDARTQRRRIERTGMGRLIPHCAISDEVGFGKPHPAIFQKALALVGAEPSARVLMVGDNLTADVGGAMAMGYDACWIRGDRVDASPQDPTFAVQTLVDLLPHLGFEGA